MGGHLIDGCKATIIDLLLTADLVKGDYLDRLFVIKFGDPRIIERDVSVFTDTHNYDIGGIVCQKLRVALALCGAVGCGAFDEIDGFEGDLAEDMIGEISAEALILQFLGEADVFVHMVGVDASPFDVGICDQ